VAVAVFNVVFEWEKKISEGISHLAFRKEDGSSFEFEPGQFITFLFGEGKELKRRSYSVASIPSSSASLASVPLIEIVVSYVPGGFASEILFHLQPGQVLKAMGPVGRLTLKADEPKLESPDARLILVGTGTGIGPYRSMLPLLLDQATSKACSVYLILGVRTTAEAIFKADFEAFAARHPNLHFQVCYSREKAENLGNQEFVGYVQESFTRLGVNPDRDIVYLCGNPNMIDESFEFLKEKGLAIGDIRREKYISS
jgi:ferredoxin-NADP reductase